MGEEKTQEQEQQPKEETPVVDTTQPDVPPVTPSSGPAVTQTVKPPEVTLNVDPVTAMNLTAQEFDKKIAEAEAVVYDIKKQKAAYIYDTNVRALIAAQQPAPEGP